MYIRTSEGLALGAPQYGLGAWTESPLPTGTNGKLYHFTSKNGGSKTAVFVPDAALASNPVQLLVWIHGDIIPCCDEGKDSVSYVTSEVFPLARQLTASKRPFVLVVPTMQWTRGQSTHTLGDPKKMNAFLDEVRTGLTGAGWSSAPPIGRLILAGHSHAYAVFNNLVARVAEWSNGAFAKLSDFWLLDTTYGSGKNVSPICKSWIEWAKAKRKANLRIFYRTGSDTAKVAECIRDEAAKAGLSNVAVQGFHPCLLSHCDMPRDRMPGLLASSIAEPLMLVVPPWFRSVTKSQRREGIVQPGRGQVLNGLGACVVPASVAVRKLTCSAADLAAISGVAGRPVTAAEVRAAITSAVEQAVRFLLNAAGPLRRPRPAPGAGDMLRQNFLDAFGVAPEFVPTWRPAGARWDRGDVVQERLRCAARILSNGSIRYHCWGPLSCRDLAPWRPTTWAVVLAGQLRICFGEAFWRAFSQPGREAELASTILHEALHIYFHTIGDTRDRGPFGLAACYERFVLLMNGLPSPDYVLTNCASGLPRGDFPLPRPGGPRVA